MDHVLSAFGTYLIVKVLLKMIHMSIRMADDIFLNLEEKIEKEKLVKLSKKLATVCCIEELRVGKIKITI